MKIATWNINSVRLRIEQVLKFTNDKNIDLINNTNNSILDEGDLPNNQEEISELCIDPIDKSKPQVDKSEPLYLCYWGKRPGTDCSMGIVTYEELSKRLIQDAKRDWGQHLEGLETMTKNSTQGLLECNLKIKNLNLESVEFIKLGSIYQPNSNSNLDVGNFYQNKAINLTPSEKYIKTNLI